MSALRFGWHVLAGSHGRLPLVLLLCGVAIGAAMLAGCQSTPQQQLVAELGVEVAAIRYIEAAPDHERVNRAQRVKTAIEAIELALAADQVTTVTELADMISDLVETANPTEQAFLRAAVALAIDDLNLVVPGGGLMDPIARDRVLIYTAAVTRAADNVIAAA